ncbi:MAG TPA: hypothetical protein VGL39_17575 [Jatrophihabitantaceae bacterium]|jgi:hypothetical protein
MVSRLPHTGCIDHLDSHQPSHQGDSDKPSALNPSTGEAWRLRDGELTLDQIVGKMAPGCSAGTTLVRADVSVVDDVQTHGYLLAHAPTSSSPQRG